MRHRDGSYRWMLAAGSPSATSDGRAMRIAGSQTDVTERKKVEEQLLHDAFHDALTGLANRALFLDRLGLSLTRAKRRHGLPFRRPLPRPRPLQADQRQPRAPERRPGARRHRPPAGGLRAAGRHRRAARRRRVRDPARRRPQPGGRRAGSREQHGGPAGRSSPARRQRDLRQREHRHRRSARRATSGRRTSCATPTRPCTGPRPWAGPATRCSTRRCHLAALDRLRLETDLRRAVQERSFGLHYQPIVCLADGRVTGFEALVRWRHPVWGLVAAGPVHPGGRGDGPDPADRPLGALARPARSCASGSASTRPIRPWRSTSTCRGGSSCRPTCSSRSAAILDETGLPAGEPAAGDHGERHPREPGGRRGRS